MKQKEFFGFGSIKNLKNILKKENPKKIFLVTGKKSFKKSGAKDIIFKYLENYDFVHFDNFSSIPLIEDIKNGIQVFKNEKCDFVIALGGGSVIDFAKLTNILASQNKNKIDHDANIPKIKKSGKPLVAIPTTSGSGSEATHFAVVYVNRKKTSVASQYILPKYCIIDPEFAKSLPSKMTAISGIDALSQAVESFWSINSSTLSRSISKESINLILDNLVANVKKPTEKTRFSMAKASNLAGKAINLTKTTAPHAISYPLTYFFGIQHGHAVGLTLGEFFMFNNNIEKINAMDPNIVKKYSQNFSELLNIFKVTDAISAKQKIKKLMQNINLETKLSKLNITTKNIPLILNNINYERLNNNPKKISREELQNILKSLI